MLSAVQRNGLLIAGGLSLTHGLVSIVGSYSPNSPVSKRRAMFYNGIRNSLYGIILIAVEPRFGLVKTLHQAALRFFLTPTNAAVLTCFGIQNVYTDFNRHGLTGATMVALGVLSTVTQLTLFILNNKNS